MRDHAEIHSIDFLATDVDELRTACAYRRTESHVFDEELALFITRVRRDAPFFRIILPHDAPTRWTCSANPIVLHRREAFVVETSRATDVIVRGTDRYGEPFARRQRTG